MFSSNFEASTVVDISTMLGVSSPPLDTARYLGPPSLIGKNKTAIFGFLKDRLWKTFSSWQAKLLSQAGREVLLNL